MHQLKRELLDFVEAGLAPLGFRRSRQTFSRPTPSGWQLLHLSFHRRLDGLEVVPGAALRHDELEGLYHRLRGEPPDTPSTTLQPEDGALGIGFERGKSWRIRRAQDVPATGRKVLRALHDSIRYFLEDFDSLESIYGLLSYDNASADYHCPVRHVRCEKALAACLLLGYEEEFDQLLDDRIEYLVDTRDRHLAEFLEFAVRVRSEKSDKPKKSDKSDKSDQPE